MVARTAAQQREIQLREMNAKVVENTRKKLEDLNSNMISSIQQQIYRTALECAEDALAALTRNNQQAKGRGGASQLANIIETVRRLNFANDETLNAFMVKMQAELAEAAGQAIKPTSINETLEAISVLMRRNLAAMGETAPERKPELGPQELTLDLVKRARRTLDLPEDLPMPATKTERKLM